MDAEKALADAHAAIDNNSGAEPSLSVAHRAVDTLARAAFEERGHVAGCQCGPLRIGLGGNELTYDESNKVIKHADPRCALPKWLTETSR